MMNKSQHDPRVSLKDMLAALDQVTLYIIGRERDFAQNSLLQDAVIRQIAVVAEAASNLPNHVRAALPEVPWELIIANRHFITRPSSDINIEGVWRIIHHDFPPVRRHINAFLRMPAPKLDR